MWTHPAWPGQTPARERLRAYAGSCNAVEGNTTFYAVPSRETVAGWAGRTAPDFRFVVKLPKRITHELRLRGVETEVRGFLDAIGPLGPRTHAMWLQMPGSFGPEDIGTLGRFLRRMPAEHRYAVEVRHPAFFAQPGPLEDLLGRVGAEWVPFDTTAFFKSPPTSDAERDAWGKKPRMPLRTRALTDQPIVRYLGRDATDRTVAGWQRWVGHTVDWLREGRSPTVFIHTPDNADALGLARRFHDEVRARVPELEPLRSEPLTLF